jgi:GNAT superfamily N-acetyltransferase
MPWLARPHTLEEDEAWVAGRLLPEHCVTVVDNGGGLSAVLATSPGWVDQLYVGVEAQGRGIGSALLLLAMADGKSPLRLWTFQRNVRARRFYENHGFVVERSTSGDNEEREPDVLYSWHPDLESAP